MLYNEILSIKALVYFHNMMLITLLSANCSNLNNTKKKIEELNKYSKDLQNGYMTISKFPSSCKTSDNLRSTLSIGMGAVECKARAFDLSTAKNKLSEKNKNSKK